MERMKKLEDIQTAVQKLQSIRIYPAAPPALLNIAEASLDDPREAVGGLHSAPGCLAEIRYLRAEVNRYAGCHIDTPDTLCRSDGAGSENEGPRSCGSVAPVCGQEDFGPPSGRRQEYRRWSWD